MSIAGFDLSLNVVLKVPGPAIKSVKTQFPPQRCPTLPQAPKKVAQTFKLLWATEYLGRWLCRHHIEVQPFHDVGAWGHQNFLPNALTSQLFWSKPPTTRSKKKRSSDSSIFSHSHSFIVDIQEKFDGSVLFKFGSMKDLQSEDYSAQFQLHCTKDQSKGVLNMVFTMNLRQPPRHQIRDDQHFGRLLCSEDEHKLISCNSSNERTNCSKARTNRRMLESLDLGEFGSSRVFVASDSEVSVIEMCSETALPLLEENHMHSLVNTCEDSLWEKSDTESENFCTETVQTLSHSGKNDCPVTSLPCPSLTAETITSMTPTAIEENTMKNVLQSLAFSKYQSDQPCHVSSEAASYSPGSHHQAHNIHFDISGNMTMQSFSSNEGPQFRENPVHDVAVNLKYNTEADNSRTTSPNLSPIHQQGRKKQLKKSASRTHPQPRERKRKMNTRDLFCRSPFQVYELLLTYRFTSVSFKDLNYKSLKKACLEISDVLNQLAIGLAAGGLAIILFIASNMLKLNSTFDNGKIAALVRGFLLIWLSSAIQTVRRHVLKFYHGSSTPGEQQIRLLHQEMKNLSVKALTVTALSIIGYVK